MSKGKKPEAHDEKAGLCVSGIHKGDGEMLILMSGATFKHTHTHEWRKFFHLKAG